MTLSMDGDFAGQRRLSDIVYDALMAALISGRLRAGQSLNNKDLAGDLGVSRTPVREGLMRLQDVGLVEIAPGRYTRVSPVDLARTAQATRVAGRLCSLAVGLGTAPLTEDDLAELDRELSAFNAAVATERSQEIARSAWAFYEVFFRRAGNPVLSSAVHRLEPQINRWTLTHPHWKPLPNLARRRRQIVDAARLGRGDTAAELVDELWTELADTTERGPHGVDWDLLSAQG
jgi:DNA-binding GntR family transcriptional regulator